MESVLKDWYATVVIEKNHYKWITLNSHTHTKKKKQKKSIWNISNFFVSLQSTVFPMLNLRGFSPTHRLLLTCFFSLLYLYMEH